MNKWFELPAEERKTIFNQVAASTGLPPAAVEKDFWVMIVLRAIFESEYAEKIVFKGGTSLSKAWNLIERFSEDIDLAIDQSHFGFQEIKTAKEVKKLRKASCAFVSGEFPEKLKKQLKGMGVIDFEINVCEFEYSDTDPLAIEVNYKSVVDENSYLSPRLLVELSARSLRDPHEIRQLVSLVGTQFPNQEFSDKSIGIPTVLPTRTLLEKIFLLHEEFQKADKSKIRSERMSRHLYDISKLADSQFCASALNDEKLYVGIVAHRKLLTPVRGIDYGNHVPSKIDFIPPDEVIDEWKQDYKEMQESMIHGESQSFGEMISKLRELKSQINQLPDFDM